MVRLVIDFLTEPVLGHLLAAARDGRKREGGHKCRRVNVPSPASPDEIGHQLGTVLVPGRRQPRALAESADQLLGRFVFPSCLVCLVT
jgi:hypothetical protein